MNRCVESINALRMNWDVREDQVVVDLHGPDRNKVVHKLRNVPGIVVALDQVLLPTQPFQGWPPCFLGEQDVTTHVDDVAVPDRLVPVVDDVFVVLFHGVERPHPLPVLLES